MAQTVKSLSTMQETQVQFLGREDPLEKEMVIHSSTLVDYSPWGRKESDMTEHLHIHILTMWRRKWQPTSELLKNSMDRGAWWAKSMGSQRVGHDWETKFHFSFAF